MLDNLFGPQWGSAFDFTLTFENWIFTLLPAALIIAATPIYTAACLKRPVACFVNGIFWTKLIAGALHVCVNALLVGLWANTLDFPRPSAVAAGSLSCVGALCTTALILLSHRFSVRSSSLLSIFLSITFLLGIAKSRSFFLRGSGFKVIGSLSVLDTIVLAVLVVLEEIPKPIHSASSKSRSGNAKEGNQTPESSAICGDLIGGFWNRTLMFWIYPTLRIGFNNVLKMSDFSKLTADFSAAVISKRFDSIWDCTNKKFSYCLLKSAALTLSIELIAPIVPRLSLSAFNFTLPWLMRRLLTYVRDKESETAEEAGGLVGAFVIVYLGLAISKAATTQMTNVMLTKLRGLLSARILKKSLKLNVSTAKESGALALLSNDIESIISSLDQFYDLLAAAPEIAVALYLLSREVGAAFFLPISTIIAMVASSHFLALRQGPAAAKWNKATESRLGKMISALSQIKPIKMMGLESTLVKYMRDERRKEIHASFASRKVVTAITSLIPIHFAFTPAVVVAGALFWTRWTDGLSAVTLFPTLVLVALLSNPMFNIIMCWPFLGGVAACFQRIQAFLLLEEHIDPRTLRPLPEANQTCISEKSGSAELKFHSNSESGSENINCHDALTIRSASVAMKKDGDALLKDVDLNVRRSSLVMVVGAVGTGKSILLRSILGETILLEGSIDIDDVPIAFCDQQAWLPNVTVKNAIVAESKYDPEWYQTVLRACMLEEDVQNFIGGDAAKVGSNGSRLSGGQKQRVTLARAVYSRQPILLLDDIFSALDHSTAQAIFDNLFGGNGLLSKKCSTTTVFATHSIEFLSAADEVLMIENKTVVEKEPSCVIQQMKDQGLLLEDSEDQQTQKHEEEVPLIMKESAQDSARDHVDEIHARGGLGGKFGLYRLMLQGVPIPLFGAFLFLVMIAAFLESGIPIFLRSWVEVAPTDKVWFVGLVVLGLGAMLMNFLTSWTFAFNINPIIAFNLHDRFLTTAASATITFLTTTGNGLLLNRSSQDMSILSKELPHSLFLCCYGAFNLIGTTAMVVSATKYAVMIMPLMIVLVYLLQFFYLRTSRQVRYLDLEAKTPLYSQLTEMISGLEHIRSFGWEDEALNESFILLDHSQVSVYYMATIQRWLLLMLDMLITIITLCLVVLASYWTATTSQPSIGLGLLATTEWNVNVTNLINYWTKLETSLGAAERLRSFIAETPVEKDRNTEELVDWPVRGAISFKNVTARYGPEATMKALEDISVNFEAGQKIGIVGRTGSGKSSFLLCLLNMLDYTGSLRVDGKEISDIPRHQLRRAMTIISQDNVELPGTIRANLLTDLLLTDNEDTHDYDRKMEDALEQVNLLQHVNDHGGLDGLMSEMEFSTGQKQLFSLARAIMHQATTSSKIILVDEGTSSIDRGSDSHMQEIMKDAFKGCTRLVIAHRSHNVQDADVIISMKDGRIKLQDSTASISSLEASI